MSAWMYIIALGVSGQMQQQSQGYFHAKVLDVDGLQSATHNTQEDKELCLPDTV